ncbi:cell surface protein SprA [Chitinophagaceae bacterium 26-R-25]|nr:cell surface protein SprA [Chitinophagaceae bacterium 26-R-25]
MRKALRTPLSNIIRRLRIIVGVAVLFALGTVNTFAHQVPTQPVPKQPQQVPQPPAPQTQVPKTPDTLPFPIKDRRGDKITNPEKNTFNLKDPANLQRTVEYDPITRKYYIIEKIGENYYRTPTELTFEEYLKIKAQEQEREYFKKRADVLMGLNKKLEKPKLNVSDNLFNRIFGNGKIDIRPQGNVDILAGYQGQNIKNPTLPENARKNGGFDFDMNANLSVIANIGDKLKLPINYNTLANFDFENQLKLDYTGGPDEIIKKIEAGNVSFSSKGTLIPGAQSLFGIKTQLQFGKLFVTGVLANERSQRQSLGLQGGAATTTYEFRADDYEENRHFLMAQYFRSRYNVAMASLPAVNSLVQILRIEVWVTNKNGSTTDTRDIVGLADLAERHPYHYPAIPSATDSLPYNDANGLYKTIISNPSSRNSSTVTTVLSGMGLQPVQDFEKTFARKLNASEYFFNPQVGFLSLNQPLQADEVLGIAFQYSYNGKTYQVGEFSTDVPPDTTAGKANQKVLFLKLLKATSQRTNIPLWQLMMKNVYALRTKDGSYLSSVQPTDFDLNVLYEQPSLGKKRYLPEGPKSGLPLITLLNLDRLNNNRDPQPDGRFDYIEGFTIISSQARVIFPLLQPFGRDLDSIAFQGAPQEMKDKYIFKPLYDTIKEIAKTYANLDRFLISGTAKGSASSDISLGAFNVPQGSVTVTAGGRTLVENVDYVVDYNLGTVKVINNAITNSGIPVNVQFENNANFGLQQRNYLGLRLDYQVKNTAKESFNIGGSLVRLGERPYFNKMNYSEDPIRNTMYGLDFNYRSEVPKITKWLNKLPFYNSNEMSTITAYGEGALLKPGHPPQIGKGNNGLIYIDDFEGTRNSIDLRFPLTNWALASTPQGNNLFPESGLTNDLRYGYNRSKIAWYNIEPNLQDPKSPNNPVKGTNLGDPTVRAVLQGDIYPAKTVDFGQSQLITFDVSYYPTDKGPYNFDPNMTANGKLPNPKQRWGGIMRNIDQTDFETGNVEYIEFWMQDPFLKNRNSSGGQLYFNLGNISEDILKDGKRFFENGLPTPNIPAELDSSNWGHVPGNPIQVTNAFSNDPNDREFQDVGLDGLTDEQERTKFQPYLNQLAALYGAGSPIFQMAFNDPAGDNFRGYRDAAYDQAKSDILARYKNINSPQGNSPIATGSTTTAYTLTPDQEDLNKDNTLNELEEYFQYRVDLSENSFVVGQNFITDKRTFMPSNPGAMEETWYLFRIPIDQYQQKIGNIPDFKSIRFIRMFMTGFEDSLVCRFAKLELVRNQWRGFTYVIDTTGTYTPLPSNSTTTFNVLAVNVEENSNRLPIPYVTPPGVERQQTLSNNNVALLQNEQALSMQVYNLPRGESRGVFKTMNMDLRQYGRLEMFVHAEAAQNVPVADNDLYAVIRLGADFVSNYYEVRIPLKITQPGVKVDTLIWPTLNNLDIDLNALTKLKINRNNNSNVDIYYKEVQPNGQVYGIIGNPNLGEVRGFFVGVNNVKLATASTEIWVNELRLSKLNEKGGYAALGRVDIKLADLGSLSFSGGVKSIGFGTLEQRVNERSMNQTTQFDAATNLELGKLLPKKASMSIPVYAGYSQTVSMPEYDPYDLDIKLKDKLAAAPSQIKDSIREDAVEVRTLKTISFTNVKYMNTTGRKQRIWSPENFDVSYSYTQEEHHSPLVESDETIKHRAGLGYNYAGQPKFWEPFKKEFRTKSNWYGLIRDFNLNPTPSLLSFRADVNRQFAAFRPRNVGGPKNVIPETFNKYFTFDRYYNLRWDFSRSLNLDFSAVNNARVDEDSGRLTKYERERMWNNFWKGGRNTNYNQTATLTYTLPMAKIPALDWTTVRASYSAKYNWLAASLDAFAKNMGNMISNSRDINFTGDLDFTKLYNKSRYLRALDWNAPKPGNNKPPVPRNPNDTTRRRTINKPNQNDLPQLNTFVKVIGRILTSVKKVSVQYSEIGNTTLAGYTDSTQFLGMNWKNNFAPGWGYVFGQQPDTAFVNDFAKRGLFTKDPLFNNLNRQDYNQRLNITAQLIPVRDLVIDVSLNKTFGKTYSELYKDTVGTGNFVRLSPYNSGSFSVSFISFQTLFEPFKPNEITEAFQTFENNRIVISKRLGTENPYSGSQQPDGYYKGYGKYSQDVLIPAFVAAYTKKDPMSIALVKTDNPNIRSNPFGGYIPKPNWSLTYNGLTRIPGLEKIFSNVTINHAYNGTLSMNSFNSNLLYEDPRNFNYPGFIDTLSGNFIPYFLVPNITISEAFAPLFNVDVQMINQVSTSFGYKKSRSLSLSLVDYQLAEARSTEFTFGFGWRKRGLPMPFKLKLPGQKESSKKLQNDLNLRIDFSIRDDATANSRLDQNTALPTSGQKVITISPSIDYVLNNRINVKLYFDQRRTEPKVSQSVPITTTRGGLQIRISLAQ